MPGRVPGFWCARRCWASNTRTQRGVAPCPASQSSWPDPGSPTASSSLSTAPRGPWGWVPSGLQAGSEEQGRQVSHIRGGQKAIFRSELWPRGGGRAGPWAGPLASLRLSFLVCKDEGMSADERRGRLHQGPSWAVQLRFPASYCLVADGEAQDTKRFHE